MIKESKGEKVFNFFNIFILLLTLIVTLAPIFYIVSNSFISLEETVRRPVIMIPQKLDFTAYKLILLSSRDIVNGYGITLFRTIVGTFLNMLFSCFLAYALSRRDFPGRNSITLFLFITMLFSGGLIPYYIIVKVTGLLNNVWVYIVPGLVSVWNVLLLRNFIMEIPESINESAEIDGATQVIILFKLIIPLSIPSIVTISLFYAVSHWNSWFDAYIFITDRKIFPLQLILRNILVTAQLSFENLKGSQLENVLENARPPARSIQNAAVIITTLPIVCVYPFIQKYFIKGIMVGSIKG